VRATLLEPPLDAAVPLDLVKAHLAVDDDERDALIEAHLAAATEYAERYTGRAIMPQVWEGVVDAFPAAGIVLPVGPVTEVEEVAWLDEAGAETVVDPALYWSDRSGRTARVEPRDAWPSGAALRSGAVRVRWTAGDGVCPSAMQAAILLLVGHWFANREAVVVGAGSGEVPLGVKVLLDRHRRFAP